MSARRRIYKEIQGRLDSISSEKKNVIVELANEALARTKSGTAEHQIICELSILALDSSLPLRDDFKSERFKEYVNDVIANFISEGTTRKTVESLIDISRKHRSAWRKDWIRPDDFDALSENVAYTNYKEIIGEDDEGESSPDYLEKEDSLVKPDLSLSDKVRWIELLVDLHRQFIDSSYELDVFSQNVQEYLVSIPLSLKARDALSRSVYDYLVHDCSSMRKVNNPRSNLYMVCEISYIILYMIQSYGLIAEELLVKRNSSKKHIADWAKVRVSLKKFLHTRFKNDPYIGFVVLPLRRNLHEDLSFDHFYTNHKYLLLLKYLEDSL